MKASAAKSTRSAAKAGSKSRADRRCGLCGKTTRLIRTECCGTWICDDEDNYVLFSYARNSCFRNHRRYTLCGYHHAEEHPGRWTECPRCRADFTPEMVFHYGTNEYNFEKLANPPAFEPTRCSSCNVVINLWEDSYTEKQGKHLCANCSGEEVFGDVVASAAGAREDPESGDDDTEEGRKILASLERKSRRPASLLTDAEVAFMADAVREMLGASFGEDAVALLGVEGSQDLIRWSSLKARCEEERERRGLTIRDVALELKIPQYRLRAVEEGSVQEFEPGMAQRYFEFLGITAWVKRWMSANRELAERVGLVSPRGVVAGAGALRLVTGTPAQGRARRRRASRDGAPSARAGGGGSGAKKDVVYQFKVTLKGIEPEVWRRIVVPAGYSFWDLHVAIQDAMGWLDSHLHAFRVRNPDTAAEGVIGIPGDDGFEDDEVFLPGWRVPIVDYFREPGDRADYEYDFGDGWEHDIVLEQVAARAPKTKYPICLDGARACPPEDCGGVPGYEDMLEVLGDPDHEEHESMLEWVGRRYDPAAFDPKEVRFDDPKKRWRMAFADEEA